MKTTEEKFSGLRLSGIFMLLFNILFLLGIIFFFVRVVSSQYLTETQAAVYGISLGFSFILNMIFWAGFMQIEPNEARVMVFFGKYEGTIKDNGFFWVNPFYAKKRLTLRARNLDAEPIKVNDKVGNPLERYSDSYSSTTNCVREDLSNKYPADWSPTHHKGSSIKHDAYNRYNWRKIKKIGQCDACSTDTHSDRTSNQQRFTSKFIR